MISVCFVFLVAMDDLYQNNDERMVVLVNDGCVCECILLNCGNW